ncbi:unnamed protein product, partial [Meganyctiphanes norvegica]
MRLENRVLTRLSCPGIRVMRPGIRVIHHAPCHMEISSIVVWLVDRYYVLSYNSINAIRYYPLTLPRALTKLSGINALLVNARPFSPHLERVYKKTRALQAMEALTKLSGINVHYMFTGYFDCRIKVSRSSSLLDGVPAFRKNGLFTHKFYTQGIYKLSIQNILHHSSFKVVCHSDQIPFPLIRFRTANCVVHTQNGTWCQSLEYTYNHGLFPRQCNIKKFLKLLPFIHVKNLLLAKPDFDPQEAILALNEKTKQKSEKISDAKFFLNAPLKRIKKELRKSVENSRRKLNLLLTHKKPYLALNEKTKQKSEKIFDAKFFLKKVHTRNMHRITVNLFSIKFIYPCTGYLDCRIKIDDTEPCKPGWQNEPNDFCKRNVDVSNFLNLHSKKKHDDFCLAYVFTFRDFTGGTLGLAWVASPSGASGGICEKYKTYTENLGGYRHSEKRSLNTGIITFLNYNSRVPPKVSQLTLAHEIGHNFGSPHDYPERCKPGGLEGNFIMFSSATSGDRQNNDKFSPCSVRNISLVLDAIAENKRKNCFSANNGAFCGNKIVEEGEECDCGYNDDECDEKCCYPRKIGQLDQMQNNTAKPCHRRAATQCSPSQGPCCDRANCQHVAERKCHSETECEQEVKCNGRNAYCPKPRAKSDHKICNEGTKVCLRGKCQGSICLAHGLNECFLTSDIVQDKKKLCEIACQYGNDTTSCKSTSELSAFFPIPVFMRPGAPCNNFQGYCDVFQKCRAVDAEGPLARLKNLLFNPHTLNSVAEWITQYWYGVLLLGVGFIVLMGVFIKCCAIHTPSSNPRKPPPRSITETMRRPINTLRRVKRHRGPGPGANGGSGGPTGGHSHHHHHHQHQHQHPHQHQHNHQQHSRPLDHIPPIREDPRSSRAQQAKRSSRAYSAADDPPPPYPGSRPPGPTRHGYGEGRGHYNRPKGGRRHENSAV